MIPRYAGDTLDPRGGVRWVIPAKQSTGDREALFSALDQYSLCERMLISVEGCVGAGKSTVAKGLAAYRSRNTLLEKFEQNPFLPAFYEDPVRNAVETEFTFLLLHFHQLKQAGDDLAKREVIADFHLGKDVIYAELNLPPEALRIFKDKLRPQSS